MTTGYPAGDRLLELLADRATEGLAPAAQAELENLLLEHPGADPESLDYAAAAADLALAGGAGAGGLPEHLSQRLLADAPRCLPRVTVPSSARPERPAPAQSGLPLLAWSGWAVAAAAVLFAVWTQTPRPPEPTAAERLARLLGQTGGGLVRVEAQAAEGPKMAGKFYWSGDRQEGYMELSGLPVNDPDRQQYQLWIVDKQRPDYPPVDGGVFDVTDSGTVVIPMHPSLRVFEPAAFVITSEPPGGVPKSKLQPDQVVLAAPVT